MLLLIFTITSELAFPSPLPFLAANTTLATTSDAAGNFYITHGTKPGVRYISSVSVNPFGVTHKWTCSAATLYSDNDGLAGTPKSSVAPPNGLGLYVIVGNSGNCYNGHGSVTLALLTGPASAGTVKAGPCMLVKATGQNASFGSDCYGAYSNAPVIGDDGSIYVSYNFTDYGNGVGAYKMNYDTSNGSIASLSAKWAWRMTEGDSLSAPYVFDSSLFVTQGRTDYATGEKSSNMLCLNAQSGAEC